MTNLDSPITGYQQARDRALDAWIRKLAKSKTLEQIEQILKDELIGESDRHRLLDLAAEQRRGTGDGR